MSKFPFLSKKPLDETPLDQAAYNDISSMFHGVSELKTARDAFLSMCLCGPFRFTIPKLGLSNTPEMDTIIRRFWMPFLHLLYDWLKRVNVCPYYFELQGKHWVPIVPNPELGSIGVYVTPKHKVKYKWRWTHGYDADTEEKHMYFFCGDHAPGPSGRITSSLSALLPEYRTLVILQKSLEIASTQNSHITHMLEYHPQPASARQDHLTGLTANFGEQVAGIQRAGVEMARAHEIRVRTREMMNQAKGYQLAANGRAKQVAWTDMPADALERMDAGLDRAVPLGPDYKYVQPARAAVVADYLHHSQAFGSKAAAAMDFSQQFIQSSGTTRTQNVLGAERFENERIKYWNGVFTRAAQSALLIAYKKEFKEIFDNVNEGIRKRIDYNDPESVGEMFPELDVEVDMSCTPFVEYSELKEMWYDGIISKEDFAHHVFHMKSLPKSQIHLFAYPDGVPRDMLLQPKAKKPVSSTEKAEKTARKRAKK